MKKLLRKDRPFCRLLLVAVALLICCTASGQDDSVSVGSGNVGRKLSQRQRRERMDSALAARYYRISYDTNYVVRPEGSLTLKVRLNQTGNTFHAKGTVNGIDSKADLSTSHKTTVSIGASYRGISAAVAINPAKMSGTYKDYEFNLNPTLTLKV